MGIFIPKYPQISPASAEALARASVRIRFCMLSKVLSENMTRPKLSLMGDMLILCDGRYVHES